MGKDRITGRSKDGVTVETETLPFNRGLESSGVCYTYSSHNPFENFDFLCFN